MEWLKNTPKRADPGWRKILFLAMGLVLAGSLVFYPPLWGEAGREKDSLPLEELVEPVPVDLNTADLEHLMMLEGIGETKAQAILEYRQEHGPFTSWEEVDQVKGISMNMIEGWNHTAVISQ